MDARAAAAVDALRTHLASIADVRGAIAVLRWDQETHMPAGGGRARADHLATLSRIAHAMFTTPPTGELLRAAEEHLDRFDPDSDGSALVRMTRRDFDRATRVPAEFVAEEARTAAVSIEAWREARPRSDFAGFQPHLARMVDLARRRADYLGYEHHPYDALLDQHEPDVTSREVAELFAKVRLATVPLVQAILTREAPADGFLTADYDERAQEAFAVEVVTAFGYDFARGRLDRSAHPFTIGFDHGDVRITTRYRPGFLQGAMFATFHEAGHAMHRQGLDPALERSPLARSASGGVSESQSRLWENLVGRSLPFWRHYFPRLQQVFMSQLRGVDADMFYRAVNTVRPGLIRVEADEVTYNLHIILRLELELALLEGSLRVEDLPEAWRAKMAEYLGIETPDHARGVMQDIHWSGGGFATFPNYALGNIMAAQFFAAATREHPEIPDAIGQGHFAQLLGWLRERIYRHGRKFLPKDLIRRVTGAELNPEPYLHYLWEKYGRLYGVSRPEAVVDGGSSNA